MQTLAAILHGMSRRVYYYIYVLLDCDTHA